MNDDNINESGSGCALRDGIDNHRCNGALALFNLWLHFASARARFSHAAKYTAGALISHWRKLTLACHQAFPQCADVELDAAAFL
jgi:hypothetical protein